ncbi:FYVE, RhoGEF and PH domain-containing protein 1-like isoform X1 [Diprion similis]|uniref:FYVE, RhoGEF and PH domain-containing protein 1-like isoform X1 n=1 Tax=Diprion similis TaxID=362088 RepID=UPI001EF79EC8|nr:FYVE, RhoGEF and PH domain-containing protein 1-like isoform X1 [Diprion similis]
MQRGQLRDITSWMARLLPEPSEGTTSTIKMFSSKITSSTSTFYTDLLVTDEEERSVQHSNSQDNRNSRLLECQSTTSEDANSQDSDSMGGSEDHQDNTRSSFHRIPNYGGFPRFQHFVMSASSPAVCADVDSVVEQSSESSFVKMSHSVLEYRSSRYVVAERTSHQYELDTYAISESDSEEEAEELSAESSKVESSTRVYVETELSSELKIKAEKDGLDEKQKKCHHIANELLTTERNYVNILHLIDQVFQFKVDQENRAHPMFPPETVQHMFSNIKSIYKFHNEFLLPQLEGRMQLWNDDPRIGDIMKNFAPFLKMYTEYVKNFDYAMNLINTLQQKIPRFAAIVNDIQKRDECAKLSLAHHMLSPIQRLPRYELLLKDYLKNLAEDSPDYEDTKRALELVSTAANHTNEAMKKIDKFKKLLEIQESIYDAIDLVSATRELVKEGKIVKISARSGDHQERYLFLLSDVLLLCSMRLIPGPLYRLRAKFMVENLEVIEGDNLETANTFYVRDEKKSVELYTHTAEGKAAWLEALFKTMQEILRRKASLKTGETKSTLVTADDVTRCMVCEAIFSVMKRKHNCRACGIVVCSKCSNQKLLFEDNKNMRVCRLCHAALTQPLKKSPSSPAGPAQSLLQVSARATSVLSGYLLLKTQASKPWTKRWFALHADFVLYSFKSDTDSLAMTATPMPGFAVTEGSELPEEDLLSFRDREDAFKIHHSKKSYYFQALTHQDHEKWVNALQLATRAELPSPEEDVQEDGET